MCPSRLSRWPTAPRSRLPVTLKSSSVVHLQQKLRFSNARGSMMRLCTSVMASLIDVGRACPAWGGSWPCARRSRALRGRSRPGARGYGRCRPNIGLGIALLLRFGDGARSSVGAHAGGRTRSSARSSPWPRRTGCPGSVTGPDTPAGPVHDARSSRPYARPAQLRARTSYYHGPGRNTRLAAGGDVEIGDRKQNAATRCSSFDRVTRVAGAARSAN